MNKNSFLLLLLFFTPLLWRGVGGEVFAQKQGQAKIDSLQALLKTAKQDTDKVNILDRLAWELKNINPDTSIILSTRALQLAEKIKWQFGAGKSQNNLGWFSYIKGDNALALAYYSKAIAICYELEKSGVNSKSQILRLKSQVIGNIGSLYYSQGDYPKALDNYLNALKITEEFGGKQAQANNLGNIGNIYDCQGDHSKALDYYFRALKLVDGLGNKDGISINLCNIGDVYKDQGDYPKALDYYFKALKINEEIGNKNGIAGDMSNIGNVYLDQADVKQSADKAASDSLYSKALYYDLKALKMQEDMEDESYQGIILNDIGSIYFKQNKLKEADKFLHDALKLSTKMGDLEGIKKANENLSIVYSKEGDWKKATEYYKQSIIAKDSLNNEEKAKKQTRIEMNYEFEKTQAADSAKHEKEMAVADVENKKQKLFRNVSIGGFSVMLLFAGVFFTQRNRISKGKKRSDELLLNILPSETAEELKATGTAKAKSYHMVTVLFTDFKNFTQASEKMSAEELVNEIHHCYSEFDKIIAKHNIEKIKTIGDSYMCAGGLPVENKTNPVEVVQAALEIQQFIIREKEEREKNNKPYFEIRIGINTGPVVAGIVGIKKFAYDIWGDTVNIASRMESSGEAGKVNISGSTYDLVKDKFTCTHRGKIDAKNKDMIDMYFVEGEKS